jgi:hypothetical protein
MGAAAHAEILGAEILGAEILGAEILGAEILGADAVAALASRGIMGWPVALRRARPFGCYRYRNREKSA